MSAMDPPLHERVYEGLKEDYLAGHFVPGKRIDIQELATRQRSSKTPVREAAFIMVGEGLFIHHPDGGFLVPVREPSEVIELLTWHMLLIAGILTKLRETTMREALQQSLNRPSSPSAVSVANLAANIFISLAVATGNRQASLQVRRLNEMLHYSRITDVVDAHAAEKELVTIAGTTAADLPKATRRRVESYHKRKIANQQNLIQNLVKA